MLVVLIRDVKHEFIQFTTQTSKATASDTDTDNWLQSNLSMILKMEKRQHTGLCAFDAVCS